METEVQYDGKPFIVKLNGRRQRAVLSPRLKKERFPLFKGRKCMVRAPADEHEGYEIVALMCSQWEVIRRMVPRGMQYEVAQSMRRMLGTNARIWYPHADNRDLVLDCSVAAVKRRYRNCPRIEMRNPADGSAVRPLPAARVVYADEEKGLWVTLWHATKGKKIDFFAHQKFDAAKDDDLIMTGGIEDDYRPNTEEGTLVAFLRKLCANAVLSAA